MPTAEDDNNPDEHEPEPEGEPVFKPDTDALEAAQFLDADRVSAWLADVDATDHERQNLQQYLPVIGRNRLLNHEQELRLAVQKRAEPRVALLYARHSKGGQPRTPLDVLAELFDDLMLACRRLQEAAHGYPQPALDLGQVLREAQALQVTWEADEPSQLYRWLNNGLWGTDSGWERVARLALEVFGELYLFPAEVQNRLADYLAGQRGHLDEATWPTPLTFQSWLPAAADIEAEFENMKRRADEANKLLIQANLGLVVSLARRYGDRRVSFVDLIQAGNVGLLRAVEKFDPARGYTFSAYAAGWIRRAITSATA